MNITTRGFSKLAWPMALFLCALPGIAFAQSQTAPQNSEAPTAAQQKSSDDDSKKSDDANTKDRSGAANQSGTSNDRLFYALPNFLTLETGAQVPPLTVKQKFGVVARGSFDYVEFPWYGFLAGLSQAENSEAGYGQGMEGYGKRYGAAFADGTIENFVTGAILPSLLKEDPRFFVMTSGGFVHRTMYAASRIFVTRTDSGRETFNFSEIIGSAISAGISSNTYHPKQDHTFPNTMSVWGTQVGYDTITLVVKEFWPDIRRKFSHKEHAGTGASGD